MTCILLQFPSNEDPRSRAAENCFTASGAGGSNTIPSPNGNFIGNCLIQNKFEPDNKASIDLKSSGGEFIQRFSDLTRKNKNGIIGSRGWRKKCIC